MVSYRQTARLEPGASAAAMSDTLDQLARAYGIELSYRGERGEERVVGDVTKRGLLHALGVPVDGADRIKNSLASAPSLERSGETTVVERCFMPDWLTNGRAWGVTCQLYGLRSHRNWGIGDFVDLAQLAELAAAAGADFVGVNPLHALFLADPSRYSPYSPSSRRFLNPLYISVDTLAAEAEFDRAQLDALRDVQLVDYPKVARSKLEALKRIHRDFVQSSAASRRPFDEFCMMRGHALDTFALYEALSEHLVAKGHHAGWHVWPKPYRSAGSDDVKRFARKNVERIDFHKWLQFVAETQLRQVQRLALAAGMRIGLYLDLAVGVAPDGAETWARPDAVIAEARLGCPPDMFHEAGQDWGLAPLSPIALAKQDFEPLRLMLDELMRSAGAVRIDHAMGLMRLYLIPKQAEAKDGAYLKYPFPDMLRVVAEVSQARRAIVIGEDLGTVPTGFRDVMHEAEIQGYRVLYFEREQNGWFRAPGAYSHRALACLSTHDLPTLKGWWSGADIAERERLGWFGSEQAAELRRIRAKDRLLLLSALKHADALSPTFEPLLNGSDPVPDQLPMEICVAAHTMLAKVASRLIAVQLEDLAGLKEQANLPGTVDEYANWRRKLPLDLGRLVDTNLFRKVTEAVSRERPRPA
jgi:4-alpha-glucanotransferase